MLPIRHPGQQQYGLFNPHQKGFEEDVMAFTFLPWKNISDAFTGIAGAPVPVLPSGHGSALFATDATGAVMCAGGDPQNGLMGPWAPVSDSFTGVAGAE